MAISYKLQVPSFYRPVIKGSGLKTVLESFAIQMCPDLSCHPGTFLQVSFAFGVASIV